MLRNLRGYELTVLAEEEIDRGWPAGSIRRVVQCHRQDAERFAAGFDFYVGFGPRLSESTATWAFRPSRSVGREVVEVLGRHSVGTEWDGGGEKRVKGAGLHRKPRLARVQRQVVDECGSTVASAFLPEPATGHGVDQGLRVTARRRPAVAATPRVPS